MVSASGDRKYQSSSGFLSTARIGTPFPSKSRTSWPPMNPPAPVTNVNADITPRLLAAPQCSRLNVAAPLVRPSYSPELIAQGLRPSYSPNLLRSSFTTSTPPPGAARQQCAQPGLPHHGDGMAGGRDVRP